MKITESSIGDWVQARTVTLQGEERLTPPMRVVVPGSTWVGLSIDGAVTLQAPVRAANIVFALCRLLEKFSARPAGLCRIPGLPEGAGIRDCGIDRIVGGRLRRWKPFDDIVDSDYFRMAKWRRNADYGDSSLKTIEQI